MILGKYEKFEIAKQSLIVGVVNLIALPILGFVGAINQNRSLMWAIKMKKFMKRNRHILADHKLSTRDIRSPSIPSERWVHSLRGLLAGPSLCVEGISNIILAVGSEKCHDLLFEKGLYVVLASLILPPSFIISGLLKRKTSM